ncbi:uncharacterized protein LOC104859252 isoform X2 [Fukomys damarensis]|uniref:uncharacterized protein LOC104859252 isoform X2 n=1 Tax=Fukomys damarensis TaxID=885580 RepID=UPI0008FEBF0B|nr:uncharacterized protein LOC104859252 isoform X2 [Fukomys damarensis]
MSASYAPAARVSQSSRPPRSCAAVVRTGVGTHTSPQGASSRAVTPHPYLQLHHTLDKAAGRRTWPSCHCYDSVTQTDLPSASPANPVSPGPSPLAIRGGSQKPLERLRTSISCAGPEAEASSQRKVFGLRCSLAGRPTTHSMSCLLPPFPGEGKAPQFPDPHSPRSAPSEADFTLPYGRSEMVDEIPRQLPLEDLHLSCYAVHQSGQKMPQPEPEPLTKETHRTSLKFSWSLEYRQATPQVRFLESRTRLDTAWCSHTSWPTELSRGAV